MENLDKEFKDLRCTLAKFSVSLIPLVFAFTCIFLKSNLS